MPKKELKHCCVENQYKDAEVRYEKINQEQWGWVLEQWQVATKHDVDDGYKGSEGGLMCSHFLLISYCPFCGENLNKIEASTW